MAQYDNTNRGTLGRNKSPKHDRSPHFTGKINIKGVDFWIAGWNQEDFMSDSKYISMALTCKDDENHKGSGRLDTNKDKMGNRPDMVGHFIVGGAEFKIAAWTKVHQDNKFLSISVDTTAPAVAQRNTNAPHGTQPAIGRTYDEPPMDFDDDIPF